MEQEKINLIPNEMIKLIPIFKGNDKRQLGLFLRKCEYIINQYKGSELQNEYIMHAITSRLADDAAALVSARDDVMTWTEFKALFEQHFGDPRTEEYIALELESLKIETEESYSEFCNRIQYIRAVLMSKLNKIQDPQLKQIKKIIYDNKALNVFLYNLPENIVGIVRSKMPHSLEEALSILLEEVNFREQYISRNKLYYNPFGKQNVSFGTNKFGDSSRSIGFASKNNIPTKVTFGTGMGISCGNGQLFGTSQTFEQRPQLSNFQPQVGFKPPPTSQSQPIMKPQEFRNRPFSEISQLFNAQPQQLGFTASGSLPQNNILGQKALPSTSTDVATPTSSPKP